jgi:exodeoxyribonuclease VII small subunit
MAEPKFEKDLGRLEDIVEALEEGELSLDDSLKRFEEGIKLSRRCEKALTTAEKKIEVLMKDADGALKAEPFDDEESGGKDAAKKAAPANPSAKEPEEPPEEEDDGDLLF